MLSIKEINLLQAQNEGLKKQNAELQKENAELKAENERLKEEIKEVKKYQYKQEYLEIEIETAKVNLDIGKEEAKHYLHEAYKFQKCLQEIKKILLQAMDVKSNAYNHFLKVEQAIDLINKAESEECE